MDWARFNPPAEIADVLAHCPKVVVASTVGELAKLACGDDRADASFEVAYDLPGRSRVSEAIVARVRNGIVVNYTEPYMRRRDPDCMVIGDDQPTDKETFAQRFGRPFAPVREETFAWLKTQELLVFGFYAGQADMGMNTLVLAPANAGFFAQGLAMLQGIIPYEEMPANFTPKAAVFVAPPFRHTHFDGKQVVVHNRRPSLHEMFSFNLYPGPSAKKGVYGMLIARGEREGWVAAHCSTVQVVTPYDNVVTIMHEGASGGGKSEMLEQAHREPDGRLLLGENWLTGEKRYLEIPRSCELHPVTDDIALCEPRQQNSGGKLQVRDAEDGWFVRVNHITHYGTDVQLERLTAQPEAPLLFFNIDAVPGSRALIWEHTEDAPGKRCPNPRVIIPRGNYPGIVHGSVPVDIRSLGVRTPPCHESAPLTVSWVSFTSCRRRWPGCGAWCRRAGTTIRASSPTPQWRPKGSAPIGRSPPGAGSSRRTSCSTSLWPIPAHATFCVPTSTWESGGPASCRSGLPGSTWLDGAAPSSGQTNSGPRAARSWARSPTSCTLKAA